MALVAVAPDKFALGLGQGCEDPPSVYRVRDLSEALLDEYGTDAHLVTYVFGGQDKQPRIRKEAVAFPEVANFLPTVNVLFCDCDNDGHADWTDEAREAARTQEAAAPSLATCGIYDTPHGRRFVQPIDAAIPVDQVEPYIARWLDTLEADGIAVDRNCKDWTRHYRVPHFCKDGEAYSSPYVNLGHMKSIALPPLPAQPVAEPRVPQFPTVSSSSSSERVHRARLYAASTPPAIEGAGGDHATFTLATTLVRGFDLTDSEALEALRDWNACCQPPWAECDLLKKIQGGRKYGSEPIGGKLAIKVSKPPSVPLGFNDLKNPEELLTPPKSVEERREAAQALAPQRKNRFVFQRGPDLVKEKIANPLWLIKGILPESGVCVIAGEPKATKTWGAIELGMALATGTPAFGEYEAPAKRRVAVFLAEDGKRSVQARIRALADSRGLDDSEAVENMDFICRGRIDILNKEEMEDLVASCREIPDLGLLVMDPLRDLHSADENDSTAMAKVTSALRWLRDTLGCSILFVHHSAKSGKDTDGRRPGQRMRGSSVVHGAIDAGIYMSDTKTDSKSYWTNKVFVEIKEGAGAGMFKLTLNLSNDDDGRATGGSWETEKLESKESAERNHQLRERVVTCLQRATGPMGIRKIREACKPCSDYTLKPILEQLRGDGLASENNDSGGWIWATHPTHPNPSNTHPIGSPPANPSNPSNRPIRPLMGGWMGAGLSLDTKKALPIQPRMSPEERQRLLATDTTRDAYREAMVDDIQSAIARGDDAEAERLSGVTLPKFGEGEDK